MNFIKGIKVLYFKELKDHFYSPLVYLLSAFFSIVMGWLFFNYLIASQELTEMSLFQSILYPFFGNMNFIFLFFAPLLTMRSFAEEKKLHTLELLLTSQLSEVQIIVSKLIANFTVSFFMISLTFIFPVVLSLSGYDAWTSVISSYAGVLLSVLCYLSVGLFCSSLTKNLVVAALMGFVILLGIMLFSLTGNALENPLLGEIFRYFAVPFHYESFVSGAVKSFNIIYIISFVVFFSMLTYFSLESRKW